MTMPTTTTMPEPETLLTRWEALCATPDGLPERFRGERVQAAVRRYLRRQTGRERPRGRWDGAGRFWPDPWDEERRCCRQVRRPSRAWPLSLWRHCHTAEHVAALCEVPPTTLRGAVAWLRRREAPAKTAPDDLCPTCGASWPCEHGPTVERERVRVDAEAAAEALRRLGLPGWAERLITHARAYPELSGWQPWAVPPGRSDMDTHLAGWLCPGGPVPEALRAVVARGDGVGMKDG
jgi:hypothetical protein